jgi:hypothetical protein
MAPLALTFRNGTAGRKSARPVPPRYALNDPSNLSSDSDLIEVQSVIREGIRRGLVRVVPVAGCPTHVRVIRV